MTELGLSIPVHGVQLIEASAGTGKTFTVATLYTRLVIELGLPVAKLLAVTYTEAAAKDLRDKLRERLARAAALLEQDGDALAPRVGDGNADALTRTLLREAHARGEAMPALRQRLRAAVAQMDLAPIHTIHGFCQRALREHALEAGQPLATRTLLTNEAALRREVATEFWRRNSDDDELVARLLELWESPAKLAEQLPSLLGYDRLLPTRPDLDLREARARLAADFAAHGEQAHATLVEALARREISTTLHKDATLEPVWRALQPWSASPFDFDPRSDALSLLGDRALAVAAGKLKQGIAPENPFFSSVDAFLDARFNARVALVHDTVAFARRRLRELKLERGLVGFDDLIGELAEALEGANGDALAHSLCRQYQVALVDEFQDTDPRQWRIFHGLFARPVAEDGDQARALFLVGDPKQAIYRFRGGDVSTYLEARQQAAQTHRLQRNFRSRPRAVAAVAALFELGGAGAFRQTGIEFESVEPGGDCLDEHFLRDGEPAAALLVQRFALPAGASVETVRSSCASNCVAAIHALLSEAKAGRAQLALLQPDGSRILRPVQPADITVLVPRNKEALRMQLALSEAGIPSVAAGRASLYESAEARDLRAWLSALAAPADDGRLRALLATPLFGLDAAAIAAFDTDLARHRHWQESQQHWLAQAQRRGAMAALATVCAQESARLLAQPGGERRLSNYLQLVEELQGAEPGAIGIAGLLAELERRIEDADDRNDAELLRLESDSARVRIMTTHVSKGLNLDLVFVPFAALGGGGGRHPKLRIASGHEGGARVGHLVASSKDPACAVDEREEAAEQLRVLYVALTRARYATWLGWGLWKEAQKAPLAWLLHRGADGKPPSRLDEAQLDAALQALRSRAPAAIELLAEGEAPDPSTLPRLEFQLPDELPPARVVQRQLDRDWWVYSFSQLAREDSGAAEVRGAEDEFEPAPLQRSRFSGTRFGNALHGALEAIAFGAWHEWRGSLPPPGQLEPVQESLRREGFASEADLEEGLPILTLLIAETLNAAMPEGTRLATLAPEAMCVEMEFHFELAPVQVSALMELLHRHGVLPERRGFGQRARIEGLLTGRIDLVYEAGGRFYVLDYKSNQLPDYAAETLARAVRDSEYDLQYVLYTLALHRWLRFRLGADYDIAQHLGGVRYVFSRGLDRDAPHGPGIHALRLPDALVLELDALLRRREAA